MRFRNQFMFIGGLLVLFLYVLTEADTKIIQNLPFGASTIVLISQLLKSVWFIAMLHAGRKCLVDYVDLESLFRTAVQTPEGAGRAAMAVSVIYIAVALVILAAVISN